MIQELVEAFRRNPKVISAWSPPVKKHILEQVNDKDSFAVEYVVADHDGCEHKGTIIVPLFILREIKDFDESVQYVLDELIFCSCDLCDGLTTGSISNTFEFLGDPVHYFDVAKGRAVQLQGFNYAEWVKPPIIGELKAKLEQLPYILSVMIEPSRVGPDHIAIHIRHTDISGNEPKLYRPIACIYPDTMYLDEDKHSLIIAEIYKLLIERLQKF